MKSTENIGYVKGTQKDYSLSFKHQIVQEIELDELTRVEVCRKYGIQTGLTIRSWLKKYGNFDWENQTPIIIAKTPKQKNLELEAKVKLLEKQKVRLEHLAEWADKKVIIFDMLVNMVEKENDIRPLQGISTSFLEVYLSVN